METMKQSPWDNIAAMDATCREHDMRAREEHTGGGSDDVDEGWSSMAVDNSETQVFREM